MNNIEIYEKIIDDNSKIAILRGGLGSENPKKIMDDAVSKYVENKPHNEFIEIFLDNPWVRVIVGNIDQLNYQQFKDQKL